MEKINKILSKKYLILKKTNSITILKGRYNNTNTIAVSLHYNFLGVRLVKLKFTPKDQFRKTMSFLSYTILPNTFIKENEFLKIVRTLEIKANKAINRLINEYKFSMDQYSLF